MHNYYITRKTIFTNVIFKLVDTSTYEVSDGMVTLNGTYTSKSEALKAISKVWTNETLKPVDVVSMSYAIQTKGMSQKDWFENAEVIDQQEISVEEASAFGKRPKRSFGDAQ